ncbi:RsmE family RNA methyltransferase, partial [Candidatus Margulisiibacteriota bacterium]
MIRLFIKNIDLKTSSLALDDSGYHYLANVMRVKIGQCLEIIPANNRVLLIEITSLSEQSLQFKVLEEKAFRQSKFPQITLAQCLPKQIKFSDILRKCTEIGVKSFVPVISSRVISRPNQDKSEKKRARWEKVLI